MCRWWTVRFGSWAPVLKSMSSFLYGGGQSSVAPTPRTGDPEFQLVFQGRGWPAPIVTGIVVGGRFLSYGVNLNRFNDSVWYRLPSRAVSALAKLGRSLQPLRLSACAVSLSNEGPTSLDLARCAAEPTTARPDHDWLQ